MTIKQQGGIFGRNPTFNDLTVEGTLTTTGATSYTSLDVDNINIDGNTISSTDTNGNIALDPDGTGLVTAASDVKLFSQKKVILNRADNTTAAEINYQGPAVGLVFNDLNAEGFKFQFNGSDKVVLNYLGNIVVNSGNGIDFSATAGTGTSELFDDYEEGTWTPTYVPASGSFGSITYDTVVTGGKYTKVGNLVHIQGGIRTDAITVGTASGGIRLGGLPFAAIASGTGHDGWSTLTIGQASAFAGDVPSAGSVVESQSYFELQYRSAANGVTIDLAVADLGTGADDNLMRFSATYIAG